MLLNIALDNFSDGALIKRIATCLKIIISHFECSGGHIFLLRNKTLPSNAESREDQDSDKSLYDEQ